MREIAVAFRNDVSFSASRESQLSECGRRYFYAVYLMWNGWWHDGIKPEPRRAEAYRLKHIMTEAMLAGKIVHSEAEMALKSAIRAPGRSWDRTQLRDDMVSSAMAKVDQALVQARSRSRGSPKTQIQLLSVELGGEPDENFLKNQVRGRVEALTSPDSMWDNGDKSRVNLLLRAMATAGSIVHVEQLLEWRIQTARDEYVKTFLAHDLVMRNSRKPTGCVIVDWKTGKPSKSEDAQLDLYAAWAAHSGWEFVDTVLVHLGDGVVQASWQTSDLDDAADRATFRATEFVEALRDKLVDGDLERNEPIENKFESTTDPRKCATCPFQIMCDREGTKP